MDDDFLCFLRASSGFFFDVVANIETHNQKRRNNKEREQFQARKYRKSNKMNKEDISRWHKGQNEQELLVRWIVAFVNWIFLPNLRYKERHTGKTEKNTRYWRH